MRICFHKWRPYKYSPRFVLQCKTIHCFLWSSLLGRTLMELCLTFRTSHVWLISLDAQFLWWIICLWFLHMFTSIFIFFFFFFFFGFLRARSILGSLKLTKQNVFAALWYGSFRLYYNGFYLIFCLYTSLFVMGLLVLMYISCLQNVFFLFFVFFSSVFASRARLITCTKTFFPYDFNFLIYK